LDDSWRGKLSKYGIEEELFVHPMKKSDKEEKAADNWIEIILSSGLTSSASPFEKIEILGKLRNYVPERAQAHEPIYKEIVERVKPDLIVFDKVVVQPLLFKYSIPWINLLFLNPLFAWSMIEKERVPPHTSGLPANDTSKWGEYRAKYRKAFEPLWNKLNDWFVEQGGQPFPHMQFFHTSPYLNLYMYPHELDYHDLFKIPEKWERVDCFFREENEQFDIPEKLKDKEGKLIYFAMGTLGSADAKMMQRIVNMFGEMPHRFIISKGI